VKFVKFGRVLTIRCDAQGERRDRFLQCIRRATAHTLHREINHMMKYVSVCAFILALSACGGASGGSSTSSGAAVPVASEPAAPTAAGAITARAAKYDCVYFSGTVTGGGHLVSSPGFTFASDGGYTHEDGTTGTITMTGDTIEFHGGALDGQAAKYEDNNGKGMVRLYNEDRSHTVIDCDGA
jgi:hypothetical protein